MLTERNEFRLAGALPKADPLLASLWWALLILRGALPAVFGIAMGFLVRAVQNGESLTASLTIVGITFVALQVLTPIHQAVGQNLGDRTAAWLYDRLTEACVRPQGMGHLEDPALTNDLTVARDFDLGMTGPPLSLSMDFIAAGIVEFIAGLASAIVLATFQLWAAVLLAGAWLATHWLLKESAVWRDRNTEEVRAAQRDSEYMYRLAVDPPPAKELRLFGLVNWTLDRFIQRRTRLHDLQYAATRLREKSVLWSMLLVIGANVVVFWALANAVIGGSLDLGGLVIYAQSAIGVSMIAFGGLNWALDGAAAPVAATLRLEPTMRAKGGLHSGTASAAGLPRHEIRFRNLTFSYPNGPTVLENLDLTIPAGAIEIDGQDLRSFDLETWRTRLTAVFQDFVRFELPLRDNVAPSGAPDATIESALAAAGAQNLAALNTILARGYDGGTELSGGQWQRVALARAMCAVQLGAGVVLLDEPTAQLDVRGESEIFDRVLEATRHATTILISHRFSTVRHADRICVLEHGRVIELGTHDELIALGGRYRIMFDLQAERFSGAEDEEGVVYESLA